MAIVKKSSAAVPSFTAGDHTILKEILHPKNDPVALPYSVAKALLHPGKSSTPHRLSGSEVYYVLTGSGIIYIDDESTSLQVGDIVVVPGNALQYVKNNGETVLEFLCIVSPPWSEEGEVVLE